MVRTLTVAASLALSLLLAMPSHVLAAEDDAAVGETMRITHFGQQYNGGGMFCGGVYRSSDPTIAAAGPDRYGIWPCGTELRVIGPAGAITVTITDRCGGCRGQYADILDLSESGNSAVCGGQPHTCRAVVELMR